MYPKSSCSGAAFSFIVHHKKGSPRNTYATGQAAEIMQPYNSVSTDSTIFSNAKAQFALAQSISKTGPKVNVLIHESGCI